MSAGGQQQFIWWFKLALGAAALGALVWIIDPSGLLLAVTKARLSPLVISVALLPLNLWFQYKKWETLVQCLDPSIRGRAVWRSLFSGFAFGIVTPARVGEFGGRLLTEPGLRNAPAIGLVALDKFISMLVTLAAGLIAFAALAVDRGWTAEVVYAPAILLAGALFPVSLQLLKRLSSGNERERETGNVLRFLRQIAGAVRLVPRRSMFLVHWYSLGFFLAFIAQFVLLILAFEPGNPIAAAIGAVCVMAAKTVVPPVTFGELGIREGFAVYFLTLLGMQPATAFNASLLLFTINILLPSAAGGALLLRTSFRPGVAR